MNMSLTFCLTLNKTVFDMKIFHMTSFKENNAFNTQQHNWFMLTHQTHFYLR